MCRLSFLLKLQNWLYLMLPLVFMMYLLVSSSKFICTEFFWDITIFCIWEKLISYRFLYQCPQDNQDPWQRMPSIIRLWCPWATIHLSTALLFIRYVPYPVKLYIKAVEYKYVSCIKDRLCLNLLSFLVKHGVKSCPRMAMYGLVYLCILIDILVNLYAVCSSATVISNFSYMKWNSNIKLWCLLHCSLSFFQFLCMWFLQFLENGKDTNKKRRSILHGEQEKKKQLAQQQQMASVTDFLLIKRVILNCIILLSYSFLPRVFSRLSEMHDKILGKCYLNM